MALTNIRQFTMGVREDVEKTDEERKNLTRGAGLYALRNLVFGSRVDTGRFRGNWQVAEGNPPQGHDPKRFDPSGAVTVANGSREVLDASGDKIIWLHNGVPYSEIIESWDGVLVGTFEALKTWARSL